MPQDNLDEVLKAVGDNPEVYRKFSNTNLFDHKMSDTPELLSTILSECYFHKDLCQIHNCNSIIFLNS